MKKTLFSLLLGFSLIGSYASEPISPSAEPKRYAEHILDVPDYQVNVRTYDPDLDGKVESVRLVYMRKADKSILAPPFLVYSTKLGIPGCHPKFTREMTDFQREIFSNLHKNGSKTNGIQDLVSSAVLRPIKKKAD